MLTDKAQQMAKNPRSPLAQIPPPAAGERTVVVGKPQLSSDIAEIPVRVRSAGKVHKTTLYLRNEASRWKVFAISAAYPDGEKSINFEDEIAAAPDPQTAAGGLPPDAQIQKPPSALDALVGKPMELAGYKLDGSPLDMSAFEGKVTLVVFWATWCAPCRTEIVNIRQNWDKYHDKGFEVVAFSADQNLGSLKKFVADKQLPWTVVAEFDPRQREKMAPKYGVRGIPSVAVIGRDGKVATVNCRGPLLGIELAQLMRRRG